MNYNVLCGKARLRRDFRGGGMQVDSAYFQLKLLNVCKKQYESIL